MPTFTAIALDRLLEPGTSKTVEKSVSPSMPVPNSKLERRNSASAIRNSATSGNGASTTKKKPPRPQLKPALYATPEVKPLPDSPSSFPPSPYIINHKRRGPRLNKSFSEASVPSKQKAADDEKVVNSDTVIVSSAGDLQVTITNPEAVKEKHVNGVGDLESEQKETGSSSIINGSHRENNVMKGVTLQSERDGENDDFFDPQDSLSYTSNTDGEDNGDRSTKFFPPGVEFFDAWEELYSDGGGQTFPRDIEAELREIRCSLLMEIEKRKQAEESLHDMQNQWERIRHGLSQVGIVLPAYLSAVSEGEQLNSDPVEDVCQQVHVARFVSDTIGRGTARAEMEIEMEAQLELKNFEIARLLERLRFYETVNQEMSQRNQEAVELARRERQRRRRRQRWIWGCIATAIALGTGAIAWSYLPVGNSSSADHDVVPERDDAAN
ncbi:hypothetical protein L6164_027694 [Bauhinia variegata]|uniref:Uncharacterized protein n=1 Tax=Bauhinia variegata TaxID=167791 RepID=A0ACB9LU95_BAUVA|nr:hypothetical protein L6164_027694 [Bauhinia variegata]